MSKEISLSIDRPDELYLVSKALASEVRIAMLRVLNSRSMNVNELSEALDIPASTAALNVRVLEEADLIHTELQPGTRGSMKVCSRKRDLVHILLRTGTKFQEKSTFLRMPIGQYTDCQVSGTCGLVDDDAYIGIEDDPRSFYDPRRVNAQLIWFHHGFLEYRFPSTALQDEPVKGLEFSAELCSEAPNYRNEWPSDLTLWINGIEVATFTSPGDYGGRRGKLNPSWWSAGSTQFGLLTSWHVTKTGTSINGTKVSSVNIAQLALDNCPFIRIRIGIKSDAENIGGMNLFGSRFGDHSQDLVLRLDC